MTLVWEGLDLRPAHGRWKLWVAQGRDELPGVRSTSDLIPFRRGRLHRPGIADVRKLEVKGYIAEPTLAAFRATHDTLKGLLDPEMAEPGTLVDDQEDGSQRWIRAVPRNLISKYGGAGTRILSIELEALDPYWYGSYGNATLDSDLYLDDGNFLDQGAEIVVAPTSGAHLIPLVVPGTADIERVRLRFTGPSSTPVGADVDGVGFLMATAALGAGGGGQPVPTLEVDNFARTVLDQSGITRRNQMTLRADNQHGEYIRLRPGARTIRILGKPAEARLLFTPTWQ